jgi:hypothetical protein
LTCHLALADGNKDRLGGRVYILGGGILDNLGLWLHTMLKILLCWECQVTLTSLMLPYHQGNHHGKNTVPQVLEALTAFCTEKKIFTKPGQVLLPAPEGPAMEGISIPVDSFTCRAGKNCPYSIKDYFLLCEMYTVC